MLCFWCAHLARALLLFIISVWTYNVISLPILFSKVCMHRCHDIEKYNFTRLLREQHFPMGFLSQFHHRTWPCWCSSVSCPDTDLNGHSVPKRKHNSDSRLNTCTWNPNVFVFTQAGVVSPRSTMPPCMGTVHWSTFSSVMALTQMWPVMQDRQPFILAAGKQQFGLYVCSFKQTCVDL